MDRQGWKCGVCRIMNCKKAEFCQACGGHWHTCFEEDNSWSWSASNAAPSSPRRRTGSSRRRSQNQSAKGQTKGKEKGDKGNKEKGKQSPPQEGKSVSPFSVAGPYSQQQQSTAPWPVMDFSQFQAASQPVNAAVNQNQTSQPAQELIQAIKKAFPEASTMPAPVKEALEKAEVSGAKQITKDLHAATSALGRARRAFQEASEARKQLKNGWMKHLERKSCGLGETIGQLQVQLCSTPGCRVQSPPRCCQRQAQHSAAELPVREQWSRRSSVSGRNGGHTWRQGGREGQTATASNHAELHGLRWCRGEASPKSWRSTPIPKGKPNGKDQPNRPLRSRLLRECWPDPNLSKERWCRPGQFTMV